MRLDFVGAADLLSERVMPFRSKIDELEASSNSFSILRGEGGRQPSLTGPRQLVDLSYCKAMCARHCGAVLNGNLKPS